MRVSMPESRSPMGSGEADALATALPGAPWFTNLRSVVTARSPGPHDHVSGLPRAGGWHWGWHRACSRDGPGTAPPAGSFAWSARPAGHRAARFSTGERKIYARQRPGCPGACSANASTLSHRRVHRHRRRSSQASPSHGKPAVVCDQGDRRRRAAVADAEDPGRRRDRLVRRTRTAPAGDLGCTGPRLCWSCALSPSTS